MLPWVQIVKLMFMSMFIFPFTFMFTLTLTLMFIFTFTVMFIFTLSSAQITKICMEGVLKSLMYMYILSELLSEPVPLSVCYNVFSLVQDICLGPGHVFVCVGILWL